MTLMYKIQKNSSFTLLGTKDSFISVIFDWYYYLLQ
ncbi:unnamed protein product [Brassica rapa]|uniref:Uncharacterized protein n=2 Tax=Brassica TaxID=3705 RepID=A0A8D9D5C9_BRACM|nr:unnamed protein product [Brassica napus]CAG7869254.1 unnamed protein product [Brassica rapa]